MREARHRQGRILFRDHQAAGPGDRRTCCRRLLREVIRDLPWPKSMRFPAAPFRWVRPLHSVVCLFDGSILKLDLGEVPVGDRVARPSLPLAGSTFSVSNFADYRDQAPRAPMSCSTPASAAASSPMRWSRRRQDAGLTAEAGCRPARRSDRSRRMAGGADGPHRARLHGLAARGADHLDAHASEIFRLPRPRAARSRRISSRREHERRRWRQGDRRRQRARAARAAVGCAILLGPGPQEQARQPRADKLAERVFHAKLGTRLDKIEPRRASCSRRSPRM